MPQVTDLADPRRCQAATLSGQCLNLAEDGREFCTRHPYGKRDIAPRLKQYLLTDSGEAGRVAAFADSESVKSLREVSAIANRVLERLLNLSHTDIDFLAHAGAIDRQIKTTVSAVKTMVELEEKTGSVLTQEQLLILIRSLYEIMHEELEGIEGREEIEDRIGARFAHKYSQRQQLRLTDETDK